MKSKKNSLENWKFSEWFKGNWGTIKEGIKIGIPYILSTFFTSKPELQVLITACGKFLLDIGHYYFKKIN